MITTASSDPTFDSRSTRSVRGRGTGHLRQRITAVLVATARPSSICSTRSSRREISVPTPTLAERSANRASAAGSSTASVSVAVAGLAPSARGRPVRRTRPAASLSRFPASNAASPSTTRSSSGACEKRRSTSAKGSPATVTSHSRSPSGSQPGQQPGASHPRGSTGRRKDRSDRDSAQTSSTRDQNADAGIGASKDPATTTTTGRFADNRRKRAKDQAASHAASPAPASGTARLRIDAARRRAGWTSWVCRAGERVPCSAMRPRRGSTRDGSSQRA